MTKAMKYKIEDKVRVRKDLKIEVEYGNMKFTEEMLKYKGKEVTISEKYSCYYYINEDDGEWCWTDEMFEGLVEDELTAEEAISLKSEMCEEISCCDCGMTRSNNNIGRKL